DEERISALDGDYRVLSWSGDDHGNSILHLRSNHLCANDDGHFGTCGPRVPSNQIVNDGCLRLQFPNRGMRGRPVGYRRFVRAAEAIRFAIEKLPAQALLGAWLEVTRFDAAGIRSLYKHADYPLEPTQRPAMANRE